MKDVHLKFKTKTETRVYGITDFFNLDPEIKMDVFVKEADFHYEVILELSEKGIEKLTPTKGFMTNIIFELEIAGKTKPTQAIIDTSAFKVDVSNIKWRNEELNVTWIEVDIFEKTIKATSY